jgi:hypothetical protein
MADLVYLLTGKQRWLLTGGYPRKKFSMRAGARTFLLPKYYGPNLFGDSGRGFSSADYEYDRVLEIVCKIGEVFCGLESAG